MKDSALQAARPRASYDIAREIADMLFLGEVEGVGGGDGDGEAAAEGGGSATGETWTGLSDIGNGLESGEALVEASVAGVVAKGGEERPSERVEVPA